jgi:hypothetical protein
MFASLQSDFAKALLNPEKPVPDSVIAHTGRTPTKRFGVYRNNVVFSLVEALRDRFPTVEKIVGEEFFLSTARIFVLRHPPRSPLMLEYGEAFPEFLSEFEPAAEVPYLADVAHLESLRVRAYHAADTESLHTEALQKAGPEMLQQARLALHPSVHLFRSRFPVVTIWAMNSGEAELGPVDLDIPQDALVMREGINVTVRLLPPGGARFLSELQQMRLLPEAVESALDESEDFDLAANLASLIAAGAITSILSNPFDKDAMP